MCKFTDNGQTVMKTFSEWYLGAATEVDQCLVKNITEVDQLQVIFNAESNYYSFWLYEFGRSSEETSKKLITQKEAAENYQFLIDRRAR